MQLFEAFKAYYLSRANIGIGNTHVAMNAVNAQNKQPLFEAIDPDAPTPAAALWTRSKYAPMFGSRCATFTETRAEDLRGIQKLILVPDDSLIEDMLLEVDEELSRLKRAACQCGTRKSCEAHLDLETTDKEISK